MADRLNNLGTAVVIAALVLAGVAALLFAGLVWSQADSALHEITAVLIALLGFAAWILAAAVNIAATLVEISDATNRTAKLLTPDAD